MQKPAPCANNLRSSCSPGTLTHQAPPLTTATISVVVALVLLGQVAQWDRPVFFERGEEGRVLRSIDGRSASVSGGMQRSVRGVVRARGYGSVVPRLRTVRVEGQSPRHAHPRVWALELGHLEERNPTGGRPGQIRLTHQTRFKRGLVVRRFGLSRDVQEVDTHEDDQKAAEQGDGVDASGRVEPLEQDGRGDDRASGESDVVDRVDTGVGGVPEAKEGGRGRGRKTITTYTLVEKVSSALLK